MASKKTEYDDMSLCPAHAEIRGVKPNCRHHTEQAVDEEVECDVCAMVLMRQVGVL